MRTVSFRNIATPSVVLPRVLTASDEVIAQNTPEGFEAIDAPSNAAASLPGIDSLPIADRQQRGRNQRDMLLRFSDWTQFSDAPMTGPAKAAWVKYRQALRDVPSQVGFPDSVQWPPPP